MSDLALSTMWAVGRFSGLADFFAAGKDLGFARFELNHAVNSAMLAGLSLDGTIASIHEPCPADVSANDLKLRNWLISAPNEEDRRQGVAATQRSIDLAVRLGVGIVVVHPGRVDIDPALQTKLEHLYRSGPPAAAEYAHTKELIASARLAQAETNMRSSRRSLLELAEYAARRSVRLALENRYHYPDIPHPDELEDLLSLGCGDTLGYWHDVGHAQTLQLLGFFDHEEWLRRFAGQMLGVHLHDAQGITDHQPAGSGQIDWDLVARYVPHDALRTCEFHPNCTPQAVAGGARWLVTKGCAFGWPAPAAAGDEVDR